MIDGKTIAALALGYVGLLFAVAWLGDRTIRSRKGGSGRPLTYSLSIAVYCTSWTFFGSVGLAAATGYDFIPVYLGPILLFTIGVPLIVRIVRIAKGQNLTSVADFLAARYGKSPAVAAIATLVAILGTLPYIALQLKAASVSVETLLGPRPFRDLAAGVPLGLDTALVIALALALFAVLFGTRHIDATEHQDGLMLAIAAESVVKLAAFLTVGLFVMFMVFGGPAGFLNRISESAEIQSIFGKGPNGSIWLTVTLLSLFAIILLPRQFHVTVVENHSESEIRLASWLFPLYLVLINIFVVPIAVAGLLFLPHFSVSPDMFVLALPIWASADSIALITFIGGLSAATAMVIVDSIALAIMVSNGLVVPWLLRRRVNTVAPEEELTGTLLFIRRVAIFVIILLGYLVYRALGEVQGLAAIGLISFAAIAQLAPAFFLGLVWRRGTARGAIAGIIAGFAVWAYTLLLPWIVRAGWLPAELLTEGPLGLGFLRPQALFYLQFEPLTHGVLWSLSANVAAYFVFSMLRAPEPVERLQAQLFVAEAPQPAPTPAYRLWRTTVTIADLKSTVARYVGPERAERSFAEYETTRSIRLQNAAEADINVLRFAEHLLTSAIGAASARLVLSLLLRRGNVSGPSALRLLDDASEALQHNRDLLQSALDQVRHGLGVFDKDMRLICWNRQFRELLDLPAELGRIGVPLDRILRTLAERGDLGEGPIDELVNDRLVRLGVTRETFQEELTRFRRIIEVRTSPMPQGGIVVTYLDITEQVEASKALERARATLERRVSERTAELVKVNAELSEAKAKADAANIDKTRFLAAASHDLLQPLNAARLYAQSLLERGLAPVDRRLVQNVDTSLEAVEEILGALLDISRLDAGKLDPEWRGVRIQDLFDQLELELAPIALSKGLKLTMVPTTAVVRADQRMLRRVLQNLISNAVKYTDQGRVVVGVRRRGNMFSIQVWDTGPGIPEAYHQLIFKEFQRLPGSAERQRGLGLGLSIVERIARVLEARLSVRSTPGRGSMFAIDLQRAAVATPQREPALPMNVSGDLGGLVVLCIDNEEDVLAAMQALLEGWRCETWLAGGGDDALALVEAHKRAPDIILADFHLERGNGVEAVRAIRRHVGRDIPAVIVSADRSDEVQRQVREAGLPQLPKPVKAAALRALVNQLLIQRRAAAE